MSRESPSRPPLRNRWLVSSRHRLLYCPITKVANTSFRAWMLQIEGQWRPEYRQTDYLAGATRPLLLSARPREEIEEIRGSFYSFVFVRSPFTRLASAFLNKFVDRKPVRLQAATDIEEEIRAGWWTRAPIPERLKHRRVRHRARKGISFREFVEYVARKDSAELDDHWAPQHEFLDGIEPDFVGRFETLREDVARLEVALAERGARTPVRLVLPHRNRTEYAPVGGPFAGDISSRDLRSVAPRPRPVQLYDPPLEALVVERFRRDFDQFGYATTLVQPAPIA